jgi:glycosyltransferase involved in cell wall biosynthesis
MEDNHRQRPIYEPTAIYGTASTMERPELSVLFSSELQNKYVNQLVWGLNRSAVGVHATGDLLSLWRAPGSHDVLHIQWPEALLRWRRPEPWEMDWLEDRLNIWSQTSIIVTTVHNYKPHTLEDCEALYTLVYGHSDGLIHLGEASREYFFTTYDFAASKSHTIIPHGDYSCFPDNITRSQARGQMGLNDKDEVFACVGRIRHSDERDILLQAFDQLKPLRKKLLLAGYQPPLSRATLKYWRLNVDPRIKIFADWIPDDAVQRYVNAADALIIPRQGSLNSGNVALGFTFGRVVVGPDEGVIGEVLRETGNPVFEPGNASSLAGAMREALEVKDTIGPSNKRYALEEMNWETVASRHAAFYGEICQAQKV